jgi:hypothetical protein
MRTTGLALIALVCAAASLDAADMGNSRILRVDLGYETEENVPVP